MLTYLLTCCYYYCVAMNRKEFSLHRDRLSSTIVPYVNAARTIVTDTSHLVFVFVAVLVIIDALGAVIWIYLKRLVMQHLYTVHSVAI